MKQLFRTTTALAVTILLSTSCCFAKNYYGSNTAQQKSKFYAHKKVTASNFFCCLCKDKCLGHYRSRKERIDGEKLKSIILSNIRYEASNVYSKSKIQKKINEQIKPALKKLIKDKVVQINKDYEMASDQIADTIVSWVNDSWDLKPFIGESLDDKIKNPRVKTRGIDKFFNGVIY